MPLSDDPKEGDMWLDGDVWTVQLSSGAEPIAQKPEITTLNYTTWFNPISALYQRNVAIGSCTGTVGGVLAFTGNGDVYAKYKVKIELDGVEQTPVVLGLTPDYNVDTDGNITLICPSLTIAEDPILVVEGNPIYMEFNVDVQGTYHPFIVSSRDPSQAIIYAEQPTDWHYAYGDIDFNFTVAGHAVRIRFYDDLKLFMYASEFIRLTMQTNPTGLSDFVNGRIAIAPHTNISSADGNSISANRQVTYQGTLPTPYWHISLDDGALEFDMTGPKTDSAYVKLPHEEGDTGFYLQFVDPYWTLTQVTWTWDEAEQEWT